MLDVIARMEDTERFSDELLRALKALHVRVGSLRQHLTPAVCRPAFQSTQAAVIKLLLRLELGPWLRASFQ